MLQKNRVAGKRAKPDIVWPPQRRLNVATTAMLTISPRCARGGARTAITVAPLSMRMRQEEWRADAR